MNSTLAQPYAFLIFLYGGFVTGLLFDACTLLRGLLHKRLHAGAAADLLFAVCLLLVLLFSFYYATSGVPRLFGFLSLCLGAHIERMSVSRLLLPLAVHAGGVFKKTKV